MSDPQTKTEQILCNSCGRKTWHEVVATRDQPGSAKDEGGDYEFWWTTQYAMLECRGCEEITLRRRYYFSEWGYDEFEESFYPPRQPRPLPRWQHRLTPDLLEMLHEVYKALATESYRLATIGTRTLLDMAIVQAIGDVGTFEQKLDGFAAKGYLSDQKKEVVKVALDVGNASAHRGYKPKIEHLSEVIDITEGILHDIVLESGIHVIKDATPKRQRADKTAPADE